MYLSKTSLDIGYRARYFLDAQALAQTTKNNQQLGFV